MKIETDKYHQTNTAELSTQQQKHEESIQPARTGATNGHEMRTPTVNPQASQVSMGT